MYKRCLKAYTYFMHVVAKASTDEPVSSVGSIFPQKKKKKTGATSPK